MQLEASQERHAGDFDDGLQREIASCVIKWKLVFAWPGFDSRGADSVLEDAQMSGLVVADLADGSVGGVGETGGCERRSVEVLDALLAEGEDDPLGGKQVLEEEVVHARGIGGCGEDDAGCVAGPGG